VLTISREDVSSTEITDFGTERFIKLPIEKYLKLLGIKPNTTQCAIINALNNPKYRFVVAAVSRRQGKTAIANIIAQLLLLIPNVNVLIMSPNYNLSQISFEEQRRLLNKFQVEVVKDNLKDKVLEVANGSTVRMGSVTSADSVVGRSYDFIIFDEAALSDDGESAFNIQLRPTLDRPGAKALFISTPRGRLNWFSRFYDRGASPERAHAQWCSIHADYHENPRISEQDIEEARGTMSLAEFNQEYMASFNSFEGQIYTFNTAVCLRDLSEMHFEGMDCIAGLDVGFKDPTAMIILYYDAVEDIYYVIDEYQDAEKVTSKQAEEVGKLNEKYNVDIIFADSAAAQTRADFAYEYDIVTAAAKKSVLDGIGYVQSLVEHDKLIVNSHCILTLNMLDQYRWDESNVINKARPKKSKYSHMADALRYAVYSFTVHSGSM
jgi:Terminase large subunit, T4likevirus-type, N-terminal/Terminase RNaseH-like domain